MKKKECFINSEIINFKLLKFYNYAIMLTVRIQKVKVQFQDQKISKKNN